MTTQRQLCSTCPLRYAHPLLSRRTALRRAREPAWRSEHIRAGGRLCPTALLGWRSTCTPVRAACDGDGVGPDGAGRWAWQEGGTAAQYFERLTQREGSCGLRVADCGEGRGKGLFVTEYVASSQDQVARSALELAGAHTDRSEGLVATRHCSGSRACPSAACGGGGGADG
jgi:hypothetical protein